MLKGIIFYSSNQLSNSHLLHPLCHKCKLRMRLSSTAQHSEVCRPHLRQTWGVEDKQALTCMSADCGRQMRGGWWVDVGFTLWDMSFLWQEMLIMMCSSVYTAKKRKIKQHVFFFFLIWKPSLRPFGLLEQTIKDTLCRAHHHNPEPQVFMLCKTSLTISHVKQLLAHVTFSPLSFSQQFRSGVAAYYWINSI